MAKTRKGQYYECWGESKTVREWAADPRCKVDLSVLKVRIYKGIPIEEAILTPLIRHYRKAPQNTKPIGPSGRGIPLKELLKIAKG